MARRIAALTVSGESKLTSPWSRRKGSLTPYIMSRMRMMPENGMSSRNWPTTRILSGRSLGHLILPRALHHREHPFQRGRRAPDRQVADVEVPHARGAQLADGPRADRIRRRAGGEFRLQLVERYREELAERLERRRFRRAIVEHAEHARQGEPSPVRLGKERL